MAEEHEIPNHNNHSKLKLTNNGESQISKPKLIQTPNQKSQHVNKDNFVLY